MTEQTSGDVTPITSAKNKRRGGLATSAPYSPPPLPTELCLTPEHVAVMSACGISSESAAGAQLWTVTQHGEYERLLGRSRNLAVGPAIAFPFFEPGALTPYGYRVRPDFPRKQKSRPVKYDQPAGVGVMVYYPPRARARDAYRDVVENLYLTEGEKKALVLDQEGYACVGLTGVWNWSDAVRRKEDGAWHLHPLITRHVTIQDRRVVIVWDQDARTKGDVMRAARCLAQALLDAGAASVCFVTPPDFQPAKGIDDWFAVHGSEALRDLLSSAQDLSPNDPAAGAETPVIELTGYAAAPVPAGLVVPRGYQIHDSGRVTSHTGDRTVEVAHAPILITRVYVDVSSGEHRADLVWRTTRGTWAALQASRKALMDARTMVTELAPMGAPMHAGHTRALMAWFLDFERVNHATLRVSRLVTRTGWIGTPGAPGVAFVSDDVTTQDEAADFVVGGDLAVQLREALTPRGSLDAHLVALRAVWAASPIVRVGICAALAAPLLGPLNQRSFAVHLYGDTSRGKSTMLQCISSVFGDPRNPAWLSSWNTTANAAEHRAAILCDLPLCYDEVGAANLDTVQRLIYTLVNGEGRGRMTRDATVRRAQTWRTIVLSNGETGLADETMATGAQARILDLCVDGWGLLDGKSQDIHALIRVCEANAGQLGADWIGRLVAADVDLWAAMRARLAAIHTKLSEGVTSNVERRQVEYRALLALVEEYAIAQYDFAPRESQSLDMFEDDLAPEAGAVESASVYMAGVLVDWIRSRPDAFPRAEADLLGAFHVTSTDPVRQRFGVQVFNVDGTFREVLIVPTELKALCRTHRKNYLHVMRDWRGRGWVETELDGGKTRNACRRSEVDGGRSRWVVWTGPMDGVDREK